MKRILVFAALVTAVLVVAGPMPATAVEDRLERTPVAAEGDLPADEFVAGEVLVGFHRAGDASGIEVARASLAASTMQVFPAIGARLWKLPPGLAVPEAIRILSANPTVRYAEPNYVVHALALPFDPLRNELYGLHNLGQTGGTLDADIDALEAWDVETGSGLVVVGVIDTGVDYNHPDLDGNIWTNPNETPGNGVDDDGNGYVDDVGGWDCINNDNNPVDDNNHGTHVSGTIGGEGNNGVGVVGVNWDVKIMPLKFLGAGGSGSNADAIECVNYAASFVDGSGNKVVRITSNSWGGGSRSNALRDAIAASGALFVAAAGNSGSSQKMYPAGYDLDNIISVAATDHNDVIASFSNYGSWVDLGAPGVSVLSTIRNSGYARFSGTSMATPHVSGVAALVMAEFPALTNAQVKDAIMTSVDPNPSLQGKTVTGGRLNVAKALGVTPDQPDPTAPGPVSDLAVDPAATTTSALKLNWTATGDDGNTGTAYLYDLRYLANTPVTDANWATANQVSGEPLPLQPGAAQTLTVNRLQPSTTYHFAMRVVDEKGNPSALSNGASGTTATPPPGAWVAITIDEAGAVGTDSSIAVDSLGQPHISYHDHSSGTLKYARLTGGAWVLEVVDATEAHVGHYTSIALDASDAPHIAYARDLNLYSWLKYATKSGSAWSVQTVDAQAKGVGWFASLALDSSGAPHMAHYKQWGQNAVKYARWTGSQWANEQVDSGTSVGRWTSIAVDGTGNPHISYGTGGEIRYAKRVGGSWTVQVVDTSNCGQERLSLELNALGNPRISYAGNGCQLKLAEWTGSTWATQVVDAYACSTSLDLDAAGNPHIAYSDCRSGIQDLKYARWDGAAWVLELVDSEGSVGYSASLALDATGSPHISYYDATSADLKYAYLQG